MSRFAVFVQQVSVKMMHLGRRCDVRPHPSVFQKLSADPRLCHHGVSQEAQRTPITNTTVANMSVAQATKGNMPYQVRSLVRTTLDPHAHLHRVLQLPVLPLISICPFGTAAYLRKLGT